MIVKVSIMGNGTSASSSATKTTTSSNKATTTSAQESHTKVVQSETRADQTSALLNPLLPQIIGFLRKADSELEIHRSGLSLSTSGSALVPLDSLSPTTLGPKIASSLEISNEGIGQQGLLKTVEDVLAYSVNTNAPGFLDKLYASPLPPGIAAELVLAVLNTQLHVYHVSPVLTLIEKRVSKALAGLFGFRGSRAGGMSCQGGSASNLTSIVAARNTLFPETKTKGNNAGHCGDLILFTSAHGHYSIEKAAQALGMGSSNVVTVPVDAEGRMIASELEKAIEQSKKDGNTPFYINATAGTTVLGSFDPFDEIAEISKRHRCWFHVDGALGGGFVFADREDIRRRLRGTEKADSIGINPHKMLGVPATCSFLLTRDMRMFEAAMTLKAGYLFHEKEVDHETAESKDVDHTEDNSAMYENFYDMREDDQAWIEPHDLADSTLQCGRRGDALKFFLSWQYYGTTGYREKVENAYETALHMSRLVDQHQDLELVLGHGTAPQCLQVCFYFTPQGSSLFGTSTSPGMLSIPPSKQQTAMSARDRSKLIGRYNTLVTSRITNALVARGFMVDFAPALEGQEDRGSFFRIVVNISTIRETVERLIDELVRTGGTVQEGLRKKYLVENKVVAAA